MKIIISESFFKGDSRAFEDFIKSQYGKPLQKVLLRRLRNADAAMNLCVLLQPGFPGDWHWLEGNRAHQLGANLSRGMRLVCEADGDLRQYMDQGGGISCKMITTLVIADIVDYH